VVQISQFVENPPLLRYVAKWSCTKLTVTRDDDDNDNDDDDDVKQD